jgi:hypothetical protein
VVSGAIHLPRNLFDPRALAAMGRIPELETLLDEVVPLGPRPSSFRERGPSHFQVDEDPHLERLREHPGSQELMQPRE